MKSLNLETKEETRKREEKNPIKKVQKKICTVHNFELFFSAHSNFLHFHSFLLPGSTAVRIVKMSWLEDHDNNLS